MFAIIRCGKNYNLVVVVTPADAGPDTEGAKFYRFATWKIGDHEPGVFNEISKNHAVGYFSGHADGLGWEALSRDGFESLDVILEHIKSHRREEA